MRNLSPIGLCLSIFVSVLPSQTSAQEAAARSEPTAAEVAAARAEGDRLIAEADAGAWFVSIGGNREAWVLHRASGMICRFEVGQNHNRIIIFETTWAARGDDVGCSMPRAGADLTMYATRYFEPTTPEQAARDAVAGIQQRYPRWEAFEGEDLTASPAGVQTHVARLIVTLDDGRRFYTHALTGEVDGWIFKQRLSVPEELSAEAQMTGAVEWVGTIGYAQARPFDQMD